jgi:CDP-diacylglycerol--serine O-phosphatidyltransferase
VVFHLLEASSLSAYSFIALVIPALSAYRLAKFNVDERQTESFIGLPTPANTLFFLSFPLISHFQPESTLSAWIAIPELLILTTVVMSVLLITEIPLFSLKFKNLNWSDNKLRISFLGLSLVLISLLTFTAVPTIILLYVVLSLLARR